MLRILLGLLLIVHGLAHALPGMPADMGESWILGRLGLGALAGTVGTLAWAVALVGFVAAGLGALGVRGLRRTVASVAGMAATASLALFFLYWQPYLWLAVLIDFAVVAVALWSGPPAESLHRPFGGELPPGPPRHWSSGSPRPRGT